MTTVMLEPVDQVEVLSVMDNSLDVLMAGTPIAKRAVRFGDVFSRPQLRGSEIPDVVTTCLGHA